MTTAVESYHGLQLQTPTAYENDSIFDYLNNPFLETEDNSIESLLTLGYVAPNNTSSCSSCATQTSDGFLLCVACMLEGEATEKQQTPTASTNTRGHERSFSECMRSLSADLFFNQDFDDTVQPKRFKSAGDVSSRQTDRQRQRPSSGSLEDVFNLVSNQLQKESDSDTKDKVFIKSEMSTPSNLTFPSLKSPTATSFAPIGISRVVHKVVAPRNIRQTISVATTTPSTPAPATHSSSKSSISSSLVATTTRSEKKTHRKRDAQMIDNEDQKCGKKKQFLFPTSPTDFVPQSPPRDKKRKRMSPPKVALKKGISRTIESKTAPNYLQPLTEEEQQLLQQAGRGTVLVRGSDTVDLDWF